MIATRIAFAAANVALALGFLRTPRLALPVLVALSAASTLWFNPLAVGGSAYLRDNALAAAGEFKIAPGTRVVVRVVDDPRGRERRLFGQVPYVQPGT